jgi:indolepyruvate ferredoxin oxidoreductase
MRSAFGVLAKLKGLRGTALDPFGRTEERRTERALIGEYRSTHRRTAARLTAGNLDAGRWRSPACPRRSAATAT